MSEQSFTISVPDDQLYLLKRKLELTRLHDELEGAGWDYGVPRADVERILGRWKDGYDWRAEEAALNKDLPMFTRDISIKGHGVLNVHYVHQKSAFASAIPLLFVHGWPGSFIEVRKILPLLVAPEDSNAPAFHVVALGLPGYGFSEAAKKPGFGPKQMAETGHKLMLALGYDEYVCQGGDWGCLITMIMASTYGPKYAKAWHTNVPEQVPSNDSGYGYVQSTKPHTLGFSLSDSPVGLLAWIYEKLVAWTDTYAWTDDEVLAWISIYWFSRAGPTASARIYYEAEVQGDFDFEKHPDTLPEVKVPIGLSFFPQGPDTMFESWVSPHGQIAQTVRHEGGGHFAAYEAPELLAVGDLRKMFGKDGPAYGVVRSNNGY